MDEDFDFDWDQDIDLDKEFEDEDDSEFLIETDYIQDDGSGTEDNPGDDPDEDE